jgi:ketosteroid isomerase-like protein
MKNLNVFCLVVCMFALSACVQKADSEADRTAIREAGMALTDALNADDVDGILAGLTEDHLTMAPNEPALDMSNLRAWHQARVDQFVSRFEFSSEEIITAGDWAYERWASKFTLTPRTEGDPVSGASKGIWVWQRQTDGGWKLARSIWNSDLPIESTDKES